MAGFFQKIFGNSREPSSPEDTKPLKSEVPADTPKPQEERQDPPQLIVGCAQSVGVQRDHNEDALLTITSTLTSDSSQLPFGLYIVADGMGGHQHGEVASGLAVRSLANHVVRKLFTSLLSPQPTPPEESIQDIVNAGVQEAHQAITREVPGGGTTMTAVLILGDQLTIAHVGDSRAYSVAADGSLKALTRDHSLVKRLVELGQITSEEAAVHPQRNVLYRALGQGEPFEADISTSPVPDCQYILLCSDGLWGVVPESELSQLILSSTTPEQACKRMVTAANEAGGPDNITAVLVRMPT